MSRIIATCGHEVAAPELDFDQQLNREVLCPRCRARLSGFRDIVTEGEGVIPLDALFVEFRA